MWWSDDSMLRPLPAWRWRAECSVISEKTPALIGADRATPGKDSANWVGDSELEEDDWLRGFMSLCVRVRLCWNWSCIIYYTAMYSHIYLFSESYTSIVFLPGVWKLKRSSCCPCHSTSPCPCIGSILLVSRGHITYVCIERFGNRWRTERWRSGRRLPRSSVHNRRLFTDDVPQLSDASEEPQISLVTHRLPSPTSVPPAIP